MNKRIISIVMTIVMMLNLVVVALPVGAASSYGLTVNDTTVSEGDEFTVNLSVKALTELAASAQFKVSFNKDVFEVVSFVIPAVDGMSSMGTTVAEANKNGAFSVTYMSVNYDADVTWTEYNLPCTFKVKSGAVPDDYKFAVVDYQVSTIDMETWLNVNLITVADADPAEVTVTIEKEPCAEHTWGEWVVTEATCIAEGSKTRTCSVCDKTETEVLEKVDHTFGEWVVTEATCIAEGSKVRTCTVEGCGETETEVLEKVDHTFGEWVVTEATCTAAGSKVRTCTVEGCGETETEVLEMLEHTLGDWTYDTENHWKVCSVCTNEVDKAAHGFDNDEDMICDTCGYDRSCKHENKESIAAVAPTCSKVGYTEGEKCVDCGFVTVEPEEVEKLPHTEVTVEAVAATCTDPGLTEGKKCSVCGEILVAQEATEALGHDFGEYSETKAPTCTADGEETAKCSRCDATDVKVITALGHDFGEAVETKAPTCTEPGEKTGYCSRCDATITEEIPALGHTWGEPVVDPAPTCTESGTETKTCTVCDESETAEVAALGHDFGEPVVTKEATCTEPGEKTGECSRCDATTTEEIPALGHDFGEWIQTKAPTEDEEGEERRDCSRCDAYETRVLEALGTPFMDEWYWTMVMLHNQTYEIEADADNGDISPNGVTKVKFAQSITYTITPDEGCEIEAVYVDGKNVGAVSEYTFKRVTKDHTIYVVCAEIEEEPAIDDEPVSTYVDVDADDWFYDAVEAVTAHGLMNGTGDGKFSPEVSTNRAMIVTILWRIEGEADAEPSAFTDVADDMWYTAAIDWAAENGIVNGYEDGTFGPEKAVTREQVMAILHRYAAYRGVTNDAAVSMIAQYDCSVWAENDVNWADMNGLLDNLGVDVTDMTAEASRAEIAAYLINFCVNVIQ